MPGFVVSALQIKFFTKVLALLSECGMMILLRGDPFSLRLESGFMGRTTADRQTIGEQHGTVQRKTTQNRPDH